MPRGLTIDDARERELCKDHRIMLIEVPYTVPPADFDQFVRAEHARLLETRD